MNATWITNFIRCLMAVADTWSCHVLQVGEDSWSPYWRRSYIWRYKKICVWCCNCFQRWCGGALWVLGGSIFVIKPCLLLLWLYFDKLLWNMPRHPFLCSVLIKVSNKIKYVAIMKELFSCFKWSLKHAQSSLCPFSYLLLMPL